MRKLHYAGGYLLMADQTCKALLRYARALAQTGESDIAVVPTISDGGSLGYAHLLVGPASQLFSTPVENASKEPFDDEIIAELERRTAALQPARPEWATELTDVDDLEFDERSM
ncbi:hypothetical protein SAMN06295909_0804 [Plantibacter sp. VKM Ac-1784]|jgi:hypothetical protein|uniref:Uncharacterized protein n=1 Tax=Plantibacter elymi (nom. nud.) TaxID=199708 RepID=A0ABY1R958_9MICO|nr:hypothetical protein [Plantibacter sp. VKM Ac-1784]SMQ62905.1 hypothetical protein SAMN06295909_0804 [Plantibacter sp. VKM Ac-1784]